MGKTLISALLSVSGIVAMWGAGKKQAWAWLLAASNEAFWAVYAITSKQYGFLIGVFGYGWIHIHNYRKWR